MMKELTTAEIDTIFSKHPKAKKIAVYNFLGTMGTNPMHATGNLHMDARLYKWDNATVKAIKAGIEFAQGR